MFGIEKTTLEEDVVRVGCFSEWEGDEAAEEAVDSDMMVMRKKNIETLVYGRLWYHVETQIICLFKAYSTCECLLNYIEFVQNTR